MLFRRTRVLDSVIVRRHDEFVALEVVGATLPKEVIGFVEEEDSNPLSSHLQDVRQA